MTSYAVVIPVNGNETHSIEWPENDGAQLRAMYDAIGCTTVGLLRLPLSDAHLWVDEDGIANGSEVNRFASELTLREIVGTVVLTPFTDGPDSPGFTQERAFGIVYAIKRSLNV
jgi:hypothetical protein